jgi:hypothetical protein
MDVTFDHVGAHLILDLMMRLNDGRNRFSIQGRIVDLNFAFMDETIRRNRASGGKKYQISRNLAALLHPIPVVSHRERKQLVASRHFLRQPQHHHGGFIKSNGRIQHLNKKQNSSIDPVFNNI